MLVMQRWVLAMDSTPRSSVVVEAHVQLATAGGFHGVLVSVDGGLVSYRDATHTPLG